MKPLFPYRTEIELNTMKDVNEFVEIMSTIKSPVYLEDGAEFRVSAQSMIGALAALEWNKLVVVSIEDIYFKISKFAK